MDRTSIAIFGTLVVGFIGISLFIYTHQVDDDGSGGPLVVYQPGLSLYAFLNKWLLLYTGLKRFAFVRPSANVAAAKKAQAALHAKDNWRLVKTKTVYYVRHGESVWNSTFNIKKGVLRFFFSIIRTFFLEICFLVTNETVLYDSPLTTLGICQALELARIVKNRESAECNREDFDLFAGTAPKSSSIFTSNLRRAQSTAMAVMHDRLVDGKERINVVHELEEPVANPDCVSLTSALGAGTVPLIEYFVLSDTVKHYSQWLVKAPDNPPPVQSAYGRVLKFLGRIFEQVPDDVVIVFGHSRWFRFFITFMLPPNKESIYQTNKIQNLAVVKCDVQQFKNADDEVLYSIDANSIKAVHTPSQHPQ